MQTSCLIVLRGVIYLNEIKKGLYFYSSMCVSILLISIIMVDSNINLQNTPTKDLILILIIFIVLAGLGIRQFKLYRIAKLILENQILFIQTAKMKKLKLKRLDDKFSVIDSGVYISCFGILIDSKVIRYNIDNIKLKEIEIDDKYLYITFGNPINDNSISILYGKMGKEELQSFMKKFNYETGIIPKIKSLV